MNVVVTVISATLGALLLLLPIVNRHIFHTIDTDEIVIDGRESIKNIQALQAEGRFSAAIDSARSLIDRYKADSLVFFTPDITDWDTVRAIITGKRPHRWAHIITADLDRDDIEPVMDPKATFPLSLKLRIVRSLNEAKDYVNFFVANRENLVVDRKSEVRSRVRALQDDGILIEQDGAMAVKGELTPRERDRLTRFHCLLIEHIVFPEFVRKDPKRGTDWASEFIVQTAFYAIGTCYKAQFQLDEAIAVWNDLVVKHPETIYAEVLFLEIGKALLAEGKKQAADGKPREAEARYRQAIAWLEKLERNREIAARFPKYKYADLSPGTYVNLDVASRAKTQVRQATAIYTTKQAQEELSGRVSDTRSGFYLEDAVRLIGECYIQLGLTDSARSQFSLILNFFPESDNLDDAQKLIADSYMRDGDMRLAAGDSTDPQTRSRANAAYELAVKEYLKFANVYPQSELISENFIALGDAYNKLGRPEDGAKAFASALGRAKEAEEQAKVQLKIGNYYFDRKRFSDAMKAYQVVLNNFLSTQVAPNAQYMLGQCSMATGDTVAALQHFQKILDYYRRSEFLGSAAMEIGNWHFAKGNYRDAQEAYNVGWTYDPEGNLAPKMKFQIGAIWRKIADSEKGPGREKALLSAVEHFKEVVDKFEGKSPEADRACVQIAEIYKELGNEKAAREVTKRISARDQILAVAKLFRDQAADNAAADIEFWRKAVADAQDDEERAAAQYELAMVYAEQPDKYDSALAAFNQVYQLSAKSSRKINAQVGIVRVYSNQKRYKDVIAMLRDLLENPKVSKELHEQLRIQLYDAYYKDGQTDKAFEGFSAFVSELPSHKQAPLAWYRLGSIYAERKEYDKAQEKYQVILDKHAESEMYERAVLGVGEQMANRGEYQKAVRYLEDFVRKNPEVETAVNFHMRIAELYAKNLDKKVEAIAAYGRVIDLAPENQFYSHAAYRQGMLYRELNDDRKALTSFELVRKDDKAVYRAARAEMGKIMVKTDPEKAIAFYRQIIDGAESAEDSAIAMIGIGDVYDELKKPGQAAEMFGKVYESYHGNDTGLITASLIKWANALNNAKQYAMARKAANEMQKRFPDHPLTINTYYFEAMAFTASKQWAEARRVFSEIIRLNRSKELTEVAYYQMGDLYYFQATSLSDEDARERALKSAVGEYEEYLKRYPKGQYAARAVYMQANSYVSLQDYKNAKSKFLHLIQTYPNFDDICVAKNYLAYSLNKLDDWKSARTYYRQVVSGGCKGEAAKFAEKELENIRAKWE